MSLLKEFINNIQERNLFQKKDNLLLAVSGGADSVVLCELCYQAGFAFKIAHCNFQLRGEESERDEEFVRSLAEKYESAFHLKKFDTKEYADQNKVSIQVAARELRYEWFNELLSPSEKSGNAAFLLTAHHADDNLETLLMNFFKGTGIMGLHSILPKQQKIVRPLLFAKKEAILQFAKENSLAFVEDSSNSSDKYTRNYFRHQLIPSIQKVFPQVEENLLNNIERFTEIEMLYNQSIGLHKEKLLERKGNEIHIPVLKLIKTQPLKTVIYEIIKDYGFTPRQADEVQNLLTSDSSKYVSSSTHRIIKNRNWLIIAPVNHSDSNHILITENDTKITFELGALTLTRCLNTNQHLPADSDIACLDIDRITFPLLLRKWRQGDYFYPLGMQKKKKLSKFFIDQKLSLTDKEKMWVIESNSRIIWIVGKRIDDRFKVTQSTENILQITLDIKN